MKQLALFFSIALMAASCAFHSGTVGAGSGMITNNQFSSISFASGTARTLNVFGIGGNTKAGLALEAKRNLYLNANLVPSQVIGQTTIDFKRTFFFPLIFTKATVSAEVIDFSGTAIDSLAVQDNRKKFASSLPGDVEMKAAPFAVGEKVNYIRNSKPRSATVITRLEGGYVIKYNTRGNNSRIKKVPLKHLKSKTQLTAIHTGDPDGLKTPENPTGELVKFKHKGETLTGELIEISGTGFLIRMQKGNGDFVGFYVSPDDIVD